MLWQGVKGNDNVHQKSICIPDCTMCGMGGKNVWDRDALKRMIFKDDRLTMMMILNVVVAIRVPIENVWILESTIE